MSIIVAQHLIPFEVLWGKGYPNCDSLHEIGELFSEEITRWYHKGLVDADRISSDHSYASKEGDETHK